MDFSFCVNDCHRYCESLLENKAHVKTIPKAFHSHYLNVDCVGSIHKPEEPQLTIPSDMAPLK